MLAAFLARAAVAVLCWAIPAHRTRQLLLGGGERSLAATSLSSSAVPPLSRSQHARQRRRYLAYWVCVAAFLAAERLLWTPRYPRVPHAAAAAAAAAAHVALTVALLHPSSGLCLRLVDAAEASAAAAARRPSSSSTPASAQTVPVPVPPPPRLFSTEASLCRYCSPPASPQRAETQEGSGSGSAAAQEARVAQATVAALKAERDRAVAARAASLATVAAVRRRNEELSQALEDARRKQRQPSDGGGSGSTSPTALETELQAEVLHLRRLLASRSLSELRQDAFESAAAAAGSSDAALSWSSASPRRLRASAGYQRAPDEIHVACPDNAWVSGTYTLDGPVEGSEGPLRRGAPRWSCGEKTAEESAGGWLIRGRGCGGGGGSVEHELLRQEGGAEAPLAPSGGLSARVLVNRKWTACTLRNLR